MTAYGAQHDLAEIVKTHLFLLCPNNSGSTFLNRAIGRSDRVWSLRVEGQHVFGFGGPHTSGKPYALLWGSDPDVLAMFRDPASYDWVKTRKAWYFQARAADAAAPVFLTKAPPFLLIPDQLDAAFPETRFIFMVRNPFAMAEGVLRAHGTRLDRTRADLADMAGRHIVECYRQQRHNIEGWRDASVFFTYEEMCADPARVAEKLKGLVPALDDLNLTDAVRVKGRYEEPLRNMNADQFARLTQDDIDRLAAIFCRDRALFDGFGYDPEAPACT